MSDMADTIAAHEYDHLGLTCKCGILCGADEDNLTYPAHLADELTKAGCGNVHDAKVEALDGAVALLRDRGKWARSDHGPYATKTGCDDDGRGNESADIDEWYADWLEHFPYREQEQA